MIIVYQYRTLDQRIYYLDSENIKKLTICTKIHRKWRNKITVIRKIFYKVQD